MARRKKRNDGSRVDPKTLGHGPTMAKFLRDLQILMASKATPIQEPGELLGEWQDGIYALCESHPTGTQRLCKTFKGSMEVTSIDRNAGCEVMIREGSSTYRCDWSFDIPSRKIDASCSCGHHDYCEHTYFMARTIAAMLADPTSNLARTILGNDATDCPLDKTFALLQALTRNAKADQALALSAPTEEKPITRLIWDLSIDRYSRSVSLTPCLRSEKKTGGWTKGKEGTIEAFLKSARDQWTSLDHSMAEMATQDRWRTPTIELSAALKALAGSDQFSWNREVFELVTTPLEIIVREVDGGLLLSTNANDFLSALPPGTSSELVNVTRGVLAIVTAQKRAMYFHGPLHSHEICQQLLEPRGTVPPDKKEALLKELQPLRSCMPVQLPESIAGKEVDSDCQFVLMLQLHRTGVMDVQILVRDRRHRLLTPGDGLTRLHDTIDGEPVQCVRNTAHEIRRAGELAFELKLHRGSALSRWHWRLSDGDDISRLLTDAGALVEHSALVVLWHKDSVSRFDVVGRLTAKNVRVAVSRQRDWFGLTGTCTIGALEIPLKDLLAGIHGKCSNGLMEIAPGKWAAVAEELRDALRRLSDVSQEHRGKLQLDASAAPAMHALAAAQIHVESDKHWEKCLERLHEATDAIYEPPAGCNATLREYQLDGFRWLSRLSHWGIGGILADDMGLGKTVQALALLLTRIESGPALVIAPTSLGFNWQKECDRFTPSLRPILFRDIDRVDLKNKVRNGDLVICSYGLALREAALLKDIPWGTLVLDEAQNIKNSNSKTAAQIRTFEAAWKIALTGTPMENHLGELWSIFHTVAPGVLGSWEQFRRRFAASIEKDGESDRRQALAQVIAPFILRRSKGDVLKDLPPRTETNLMVDLSADERLRYDQVRLAAVSELDQIGDENLSQDQRFRVLQLLTRLRQLACHIGLVDDQWKGSSSKLDVLMEQMEQLKERGNRPLIFSQFTSHLRLIRNVFDKAGVTYQYLDGHTTPSQRQARVEAFQRGESDAFLISLKAGGTGLNLTAADYVIHMDPWWNPAVEDQATDRAHRIGQTRPVMVYRIIARDTIEEQILTMHEEKRNLVDSVLSGADAAAKLSTKELAELIRQGVSTPTKKRRHPEA